MQHLAMDPRLDRVLHELEEQPTRRTRELAAIVELHPSHLQHLFTKHFGMSISSYSMELRLQHARRLLITTYKPIKQVRHEAGIPNGPNFVRYFKSRFLMTPSDYRKTHQNRFDEQITVLTNENPLPRTRSLVFTARATENIDSLDS
jgi:two-component system response regulator YesN